MTIEEFFIRIVGTNPIVHGLIGGIIIALLNLIGATLVLVWRNPEERSLNAALGFAAGVMLAASFTSLILPGIDAANGNPLPVLIGIIVGALFLDHADGLVPHAHYLLTGRKRVDAAEPGDTLPVDDARLASVVLFVLATSVFS
jgi:ZIP family zinc transporter